MLRARRNALSRCACCWLEHHHHDCSYVLLFTCCWLQQ